MRICHVTPHLPPDQTANALLPFHLGGWARGAGHEAAYVAHPARWSSETRALPGPVTRIPWRSRGRAPWLVHKLRAARQILQIARRVDPVVQQADLVHLHGNGLLIEIGAQLARRRRKPIVLTLYGTDVWHYRRRRPLDLFTRAYDEAGRVTFYSERLRRHAAAAGLRQDHAEVIHPPVAPAFSWAGPARRRQARAALGLDAGPVLLNVKRLHPVGGQEYAIDALPAVVRAHPDVRLVFCGAGPLRPELEARARRRGVADRVRFAGLVNNDAVATWCAAADLFLLPSRLESLGTVALEALASGTPVVSSDTPGGLELRSLFGDDVTIVPREDPDALARAVVACLRDGRRASAAARERIERDLRPGSVARRFLALYESVLASGEPARSRPGRCP